METTKWIIDGSHSEIQFKVKHLMISTVTGQFNSFNATLETEGEDFTTAKVNFTADINSISTNNAQRDGHLQSGDFFDAANHPQITFVSDKAERSGEDTYKVYGTLTMRGVSKPVTLEAELGGITQDPWGNTRAGITLTGKINRTQFGVSFGAVAEAGGVMLADEVKIIANAQFVKQAEKMAA